MNFGPVGAASKYVSSGRLDPLPSWYNLAEYTTRDRIISKGHQGPLNWYKSAMRGINLTDESEFSEEDKFCQLPALLVVSDQDYVTRADMQTQNTSKWVKELCIETLHCGHWIQLEKADELHKLLEDFSKKVAK